MARQEYGTSEAVDEEEMTGLDTICSKNTFETESLEVLEDGGHLTPESESSRPYLSEKDSVELAASHTVTCTFTVSLAVPIVVPSKYLTQTSDVAEVQRNSIQGDKYAAIPRMRRYYHIEYFLLPDDTVPRKLDLVLFGMIAKLFAESDSKTITPWFENDQIWVSWNHSIDINVTNEYLMKLRDHKITLKLWDSKDKVSSKAKISQPKIFSSQVEDVDAVGKPNANKHIMYLEIVTVPISKLLIGLFEIHLRGSGPKKILAAGNKRMLSHVKLSNAQTTLMAMAKKHGIASLQLDLMPLLAGEKSVISRLEENNPKVLDAYASFTVAIPLLSERQRYELNPLVIKICSATCLPNTPVPIEELQKLCVPTYCKYKFHNFPTHQTHGQIHGTHVYFKDVNVLLTGTMKAEELQGYLRGPPMEIEVHDRDRNMANDTKKPCLFGEDQADEKVGEVSLLACKSTIYNSFTESKAWHPHGIAKVSLADLLLGKKCLNISVPIHSCSAPNAAVCKEKDKNERIVGSVDSFSLLPMGHYLESDSLLKVRVEIAVPLKLQAETADAEVTNYPYGCIIYIFDYNNASLLHDLVEEITEINAEALQLDCYPVPLIRMALATLKLKTTLKEVSELDIVTGFHVLDGAIHLFVLEGLKDKAIKRLWDRHFERVFDLNYGQLEILYNSQLSFRQRLYVDLEAILYHFRLCKPLFTITKQPLLYVRGMVPWACFQALSRLSYLCHSKRLRDVVHGDLLPSAEMIRVLSQEFGIPLTKEDLFTQKLPLPILEGRQNSHAHVKTVKNPKFEAFRIFPVDGKSVYNYSSQGLNSAELAKKRLRQEMAKKPKKRFAYCHEYLSAMFDPVDLVAAYKEFLAKSKSMWLSPDGFVFPGYKSSIESNLHPQMPDEARLKELSEKWQENILFGNMDPVLSRDRWSWDKRHIDFDLYKKPPELFMTTVLQRGNGSVLIW
uniref:Cilia and flagella associated protein 92 (putative) n=1 Tax=Apteryx owenii TaxID=8824 RepID=A0A8B9Q7S2_APTOW